MNDATAIIPITLSSPTNAGGLVLRWASSTGKLHWLEPESGRILAWQGEADIGQQKMQNHLATLAACRSGHLLLGMEKRLCIAPSPARTAIQKKASQTTRILVTVDAVDPRTIIGDGRTDRSGNFVFGTRNIGQDRRPIGSFYQYSNLHGLRRLALPTVTWAANICFSRDGSRMYFGDATSNVLQQCCYDAQTAQTTQVQEFASAADDSQILDAVVDSDDCVWIVQRTRGLENVIVRYGPDGKIISTIALATGQACSLAFGGASLDRLFMVSATGALMEMPYRLAQGLADAEFDNTSFELATGWLPPNPAPPGHA